MQVFLSNTPVRMHPMMVLTHHLRWKSLTCTGRQSKEHLFSCLSFEFWQWPKCQCLFSWKVKVKGRTWWRWEGHGVDLSCCLCHPVTGSVSVNWWWWTFTITIAFQPSGFLTPSDFRQRLVIHICDRFQTRILWQFFTLLDFEILWWWFDDKALHYGLRGSHG